MKELITSMPTLFFHPDDAELVSQALHVEDAAAIEGALKFGKKFLSTRSNRVIRRLRSQVHGALLNLEVEHTKGA